MPVREPIRRPMRAGGNAMRAGPCLRRVVRRAFTLVELLIVVVILGILAAVVIPRFSDASTDAKFSALQTNLSVIRRQIEVFKLEHGGVPPDANLLDQMTQKTDFDRKVGTGGRFGPYLQSIPNNPFTNPPSNATDMDPPGPDKAWYYDDSTGEFRANDGGKTNGIPHNSL